MAKESETSSRFKSQFIMTNEILTFTSDVFGEIRTCQVNNQIMFVGKDVATALGYSNTRDALSKHVDAEDKGTVAIRDTAYETRVTLINESGLYSLILSSKLPKAKAFKRWVTAEVQHCNNCNSVMFRKNNENKA
jgi:prophage antirepressor-like protein